MKRAQVTIFIVLGILIFASFSFIQNIREQAIQRQLDSAADSIVQDLLQTTTIENYVGLCLDTISSDALYLLEQQGGVIFPHQGASIYQSNPRFLPFNIGHNYSANVTYGVSLDRSYTSVDAPQYPCGKSGKPPAFCGYLNNLSVFTEDMIRYNKIRFGADTLNPLCRTAADCLYMYGTKSGFNSIQEQMEHFIEVNIPNCVNFSSFAKKLSHNVTVADSPDVHVQFKSGSVEIRMDYPLNITFQKDSVSKKVTFTSNKQSKFMTLYILAYEIIRREITNVTFTPMAAYTVFDYDLYPYQYVLLKDYYMGNDVFRIINPKGFLKGENELFQFAIENRNPVLDYIPGKLPVPKQYDIVVMENNTLVIKAKGYDPDSDKIEYHYRGWMADYNITYVNPSGKYDYPNVYHDGIYLGKIEDLMVSQNIISSESAKLPDDVNVWEDSSFYKETESWANYYLNGLSIGPHNVTVFIFDNQSLIDYQTVRILVDDALEADASLSRSIFTEFNDYYPDDRFTSIEDPFILDASATSDEINAGGIVYEWSDSNETPSILLITENLTMYFPADYDDLDITNMSDVRFSDTARPFGNHNLHFLTLTAKSEGMTGISSESISKVPLEVYSCIPYQSDIEPYPYNGEENPFFANHSCCYGSLDDKNINEFWGRVKDINSVCYERKLNVKAGDPIDRDDILDRFCGSDSDCSLSSMSEVDVSDYKLKNDVARVLVRRYCDGDRGNVCLGDLKVEADIIEACGDIDMYDDWQKTYQVETCVGAEEIAGVAKCSKYVSGKSFEQSNGLNKLLPGTYNPSTKSADGSCSSRTWCVDSIGSSLSSLSLKTSGKFLVDLRCSNGVCGYAGDSNSFDCTKLNGYDITNVDNGFITSITALLSEDTILAGKSLQLKGSKGSWFIYTYSCGDDSGQSKCYKDREYDLDNYPELIYELQQTPGFDVVAKNLASIQGIQSYSWDVTWKDLEESQKPVCGDDDFEYVTPFRWKKITSGIPSGYNSVDQGSFNNLNVNGGNACCKNPDSCSYDAGGIVRYCYDSTDDFSNGIATINANSFNSQYGKKIENQYMICNHGSWVVLTED
ncbi:hypothetical protein JXM83_06095 [Candidatus Woesearchaeota archaeon]|nr:hypothetical protein [Candidatus Woesearchaeota archaeon]